MKCNQFFTGLKRPVKKSMFQLTTEAGAYYYNMKWLQHICQSKLFEKLVKMMSFF